MRIHCGASVLAVPSSSGRSRRRSTASARPRHPRTHRIVLESQPLRPYKSRPLLLQINRKSARRLSGIATTPRPTTNQRRTCSMVPLFKHTVIRSSGRTADDAFTVVIVIVTEVEEGLAQVVAVDPEDLPVVVARPMPACQPNFVVARRRSPRPLERASLSPIPATSR